ncbi:hypothetical protein PpBr36_03653 [Pyricularia pennisetigena]|uniref:hypothetical protein n=1 Tax=Pyricularia pennisetigena TaxID=1578925 RepID=UPI00114D5C3B|nr:hypothetical protein PpBr36_03653 [Pyricularia pennisetigena]TLS30584.1 hypothetical protein PpBr36_03653 [Pyricularia pennisetigena]
MTTGFVYVHDITKESRGILGLAVPAEPWASKGLPPPLSGAGGAGAGAGDGDASGFGVLVALGLSVSGRGGGEDGGSADVGARAVVVEAADDAVDAGGMIVDRMGALVSLEAVVVVITTVVLAGGRCRPFPHSVFTRFPSIADANTEPEGTSTLPAPHTSCSVASTL